MKKDILYEAKDAFYPEYKLKVIRDTQTKGILSVFHKRKKIYQQMVVLAYGATFGADIMDIQAWGYTACTVVDDHRKVTSK